MDRVHSKDMKAEKCLQNPIRQENFNDRNHLKELGVDGRIVSNIHINSVSALVNYVVIGAYSRQRKIFYTPGVLIVANKICLVKVG